MRKEKRNHLRRLLACLLVAVMMLTAIYPTFAAETAEGDVSPAAEVQTDVAENAADATPVMDGDLDAQEIAAPATAADDAISAGPAPEEPAPPAGEETADEPEAAAPAGEDSAPAAADAPGEADGEPSAPAEDQAADEILDLPGDTEPPVWPIRTSTLRLAPFLQFARGPLLRKAPARGPVKAENPEGIELAKNVTMNDDGTYTVHLEVYTTGNVTITTEEHAIPTDIVLVLDVSGSMAEHLYDYAPYQFTTEQQAYSDRDSLYMALDNGSYAKVTVSRSGTYNYSYTYSFNNGSGTVTYRRAADGTLQKRNGYNNWGPTTDYASWEDFVSHLNTGTQNGTKMDALKSAVNQFIATVNSKAAEDNVDHRIALVKFAGDKTGTVGNDTYSYYDYNYTQKMTNGLLDVQDNYGMLTGLVNGLTASGATSADYGMEHAADILSAAGQDPDRNRVVVMFTDGQPTHSNGFETAVANAAINTSKSIKDLGTTVYSVAVVDGASGDPDATGDNFNRYMNGVSSNYPNATGLTSLGSKNDQLQPGQSYYQAASSAEGLSSVFAAIANSVESGGTTATLTEESLTTDLIAPAFELPAGVDASDIRVYTADCTGKDGDTFTFAPQVPMTDAEVTINGSAISVSNFDFSTQYVAEVTTDGVVTGYRGQKLIIEFPVALNPDYLGGSNTQTNGDASGVYQDGSSTEPVATFEVPSVDVPLKRIEPHADDWNIYLTTEDQLADQFENLTFTIGDQTVDFPTLFNGVNNAGVDVSFTIKDADGNVVDTFVIPAGETSGTWTPTTPELSGSNYTIECTVADHGGVLAPVTAATKIQLNVFKPELTFADKNVYYQGEQVDLSTLRPTEVWKCGDTLDTDVDMDTAKPTLTYTYGGVSGTTVDQTTDYTVSVTRIGVEGQDDLNLADSDAVTFLRDCTVEGLSGETASADEAFLIHVYLPTVAFADLEAYYGDQVTLPDYAAGAAWTSGDGTAAPGTMDNAMPALTVETTADESQINAGGYVIVKEDIPVKAVITMGGADVTQALIDAGRLTRTCEFDGSHTAVTVDTAYVVHVRTVSLLVSKSIAGAFADLTGTFSFTVTVTPAADSGLPAVEETFQLGDGESRTLTELPRGAFSVQENDVPAGYTATFLVNGEAADGANNMVSGTLSADRTTVSVTNTLDDVPITGISDGSHAMYIYLVSAAGLLLVLTLVLSARRRSVYRGRHIRG